MTTNDGDGLWVDIEVGPGQAPLRYVGSRPSARFPVYTRANAGEVYPEVVWPLSYTTAFRAGSQGFEDSSLQAGILRRRDIAGDESALNGVFGGYAYLNLSAIRVSAIRSPGVTLADIDTMMIGPSAGVPHVPDRRDRSLLGTLGSIRYGLRTLRTTALPQLDADVVRAREFLAALPDPATADDRQLWEASQRSMPLASELFARHLYVSSQSSVPMALLARFCEQRLRDPSMVMRLVTGAGGVASAAPSQALWDLGRRVAGAATLTAAFDAGMDGLLARLRASADSGDDGARGFLAAFERFIAEFGSRGPNEWETACHTWGTRPELALALIDRMRAADPLHDPRRAQERMVADREVAMAEASARLSRRRQRQLRGYVDGALLFSQGRERAKTTIVAVIHGSRILLRELGRRCAARALAAGDTAARDDDLWFVAHDEVEGYIDRPAAYADVIAERRAVRAALAARVPPFAFSTRQPPLATWELRERPVSEQAGAGAVLSGVPGCPGVARGRARIVLDPGDPGALGPGDVLVAPITDPAWTPLFLAAEAVVVDVGAQMSHAVIVSRELGIPCVVSVTDATRLIPDGALIEVDGTAGRVRILESAD